MKDDQKNIPPGLPLNISDRQRALHKLLKFGKTPKQVAKILDIPAENVAAILELEQQLADLFGITGYQRLLIDESKKRRRKDLN